MVAARVVVTGGAGFIGSHLVDRLLAANEVIVLDRIPEPEAKNLEGVRGQITYAQGDVRSPDDLNAVFQGAEVVFHLAALASVPESFRQPDAYNDTNSHGTLAVLRAAMLRKVRRVVFASSCAVYGRGKPPLREDAPLDLLSPYAITKTAGELWCRLYHDLGMETVALRIFNAYGPRQPAEGGAIVPSALRAIAFGTRPVVYGDGEQTRDFVYVRDVAEAFVQASSAGGVSGEVINVGTGTGTSVNQLLSVVSDVFGKEVTPEHRPARAGDIRVSVANPDKAARLLRFHPRVDLAQGVLATAEGVSGALTASSRP